MKITKAVITAASKEQNTLPLQKLVDRDGMEKSVLSIIIEETIRAGIEEICIIVSLCTGSRGSCRSLTFCSPKGTSRIRSCAVLCPEFC